MPFLYTTKTLLGGDPDTNSRHVYHFDSHRELVRLNTQRRPWTEWNKITLGYLERAQSMSDLRERLIQVSKRDMLIVDPDLNSIEERGDVMRLWGWYDDADQTEPSYDPPHDAPCPYCFAPMTDGDVRTHSLMMAGKVYAKRSYFYRTHRTCDDVAMRGRTVSPDAEHLVDGRMLDTIFKIGD